MAIDGLFSSTVNMLGKSLDLRVQNHTRISANLANAETPGYTPTSLSFESELKDALRNKGNNQVATNPRHIPLNGMAKTLDQVKGTIIEEAEVTPGMDRNKVELEREMGKMAQNQIMYNASIQLLAKKFEALKTVIKGGV